MSVFFNMESAFQIAIASIANGVPIQNENNSTYTPVLGTKYWRTTNMPAASTLITADAVQKHAGIYQIDVFVPTDVGLADLFTDLDLIYAAFNTTESLIKNNAEIIIQGIGRGKVVREEAWLHGFINIQYICYAR